jgi:hypothetical protein
LRTGYRNRPGELLAQPLKKKQMQVIHQEADLTFQPKISEKTQVLAEKKNEGLNVYDRLTLEQQ